MGQQIGRHGPQWAECCPTLADANRVWLGMCQNGPMLVERSQMLDAGQTWPTNGSMRSDFVKVGPNLGSRSSSWGTLGNSQTTSELAGFERGNHLGRQLSGNLIISAISALCKAADLTSVGPAM